MKIRHVSDVESRTVEMDGASGCTVRWLVDEGDGAPNFAMRYFEVSVGGHTPKHQHPYEHEVFVLEGEGVVLAGGREHALRGGHVVFVPPDELHQFRNTGDQPIRFLCLVPNSGAGNRACGGAECGAR